jgi:hypothetical protein
MVAIEDGPWVYRRGGFQRLDNGGTRSFLGVVLYYGSRLAVPMHKITRLELPMINSLRNEQDGGENREDRGPE